MADQTTTNVLLAIPSHGSDVDTWDQPVNNDFSAIDGFIGGVQGIGVSSSPITLTAPSGTPMPSAGPTQAQNAVLKFSGTVTAPVTVTLPLPGYYIIDMLGVSSASSSVITLRAVASGEVIGLPNGAIQHIYNDGTNVRYVNLPLVGTYIDYAVATVPGWITSCTIPPFLNCDGTTFSAVTYPTLALLLGGTTLPDLRGRSRTTLNQGTGRVTTAGSGIDGNTRFSAGGSQNLSIQLTNLPAAPVGLQGTVTVTSTINNVVSGQVISVQLQPQNAVFQLLNSGTGSSSTLTSTGSLAPGSTLNLGSGTALQSMNPTVISGITLIRAA